MLTSVRTLASSLVRTLAHAYPSRSPAGTLAPRSRSRRAADCTLQASAGLRCEHRCCRARYGARQEDEREHFIELHPLEQFAGQCVLLLTTLGGSNPLAEAQSRKAAELLASRCIDHVIVDGAQPESKRAREALWEAAGSREYPLIFRDKELLGGYGILERLVESNADDGAFDAAFAPWRRDGNERESMVSGRASTVSGSRTSIDGSDSGSKHAGSIELS